MIHGQHRCQIKEENFSPHIQCRSHLGGGPEPKQDTVSRKPVDLGRVCNLKKLLDVLKTKTNSDGMQHKNRKNDAKFRKIKTLMRWAETQDNQNGKPVKGNGNGNGNGSGNGKHGYL